MLRSRTGWLLTALALAGATARCGTTSFSASGDAGGDGSVTREASPGPDASGTGSGSGTGTGSGSGSSSGPGSSGSGSFVGSGSGSSASCVGDSDCDGGEVCCLMLGKKTGTCSPPSPAGSGGACGSSEVEVCYNLDEGKRTCANAATCSAYACDPGVPVVVFACPGPEVMMLQNQGFCVADSGGMAGSSCMGWEDCLSGVCCPVVSNGSWSRECRMSCPVTAPGCTFGGPCTGGVGTCSYYECTDTDTSMTVLEQQCTGAAAVVQASGPDGVSAAWSCAVAAE
jgi:hypothetical protein